MTYDVWYEGDDPESIYDDGGPGWYYGPLVGDEGGAVAVYGPFDTKAEATAAAEKRAKKENWGE